MDELALKKRIGHSGPGPSLACSPPEIGSLPAEVTRFIGRRRELSEARRRLEGTRLLTLTGMGGVGKTRLALRLASDVRRAFRDGVWLVQLAELREPSLLLHTVAAALGLREHSSSGRADTIIAHLTDRNILLVLDNCEHIVEACADLVDGSLVVCRDVHVLATSRQPLGAVAESILPVAPLSVPDPRGSRSFEALQHYDAVELFLDRIASAGVSVAPSEQNAELLARLCDVLDGIPLALELAAVRTRSLSIAEILERMENPYRLLTMGRRTAPARQQTMRASIDWSFDLCSPAERQLWARCSVFAGGFELDAAEEVCAGDGLAREAIIDLVASLVDKSILIKQEGIKTRFHVLEALRQYGEERRAEGDDVVASRRRHRDWYGDLAAWVEEHWVGPAQPDLIGRLRHEHANLRKALEFCASEPGEAEAGMRLVCALEPYWSAQGLMSEGRLWLGRFLGIATDATILRARGLRLNAWLAILQGAYEAAEAMLDEAHVIAAKTDDPVSQAYVVQTAGLLAMFRGDQPEAMRLFEDAVPTFRAAGHRIGMLQTLYDAALASGLAGHGERAAGMHEECQSDTEPVGESWFRSRSLWAMGLDALRDGDAARAAMLERQSLQLKRTLDDRLGIAWSIEALAWIASSEGDGERAAVLLGAAETIWRAMGMSLVALPTFWSLHVQGEGRARAVMKDQAFQDACARGRALPVSEAIVYALGEPRAEPSADDAAGPALTRRESQVSQLVADGLSNREIASRLVISPRTAETHVENILRKLNFTARAQVASWVTEQRGQTGR
jgi:serine/threonine-protein kinase PknK